MSAEDQMGRSLKRARRAMLASEDIGLGEGGPTSRSRHRETQMLTALAQAEETARLADEQRTANLIALLPYIRTNDEINYTAGLIYGRMGLERRS